MTDALGNEIKIGEVYGYSQNSNGITTIIVGRAKGLTDKSVSLTVLTRKVALYSADPEERDIQKPTVNVKGNMLFPVSGDYWLGTYLFDKPNGV